MDKNLAWLIPLIIIVGVGIYVLNSNPIQSQAVGQAGKWHHCNLGLNSAYCCEVTSNYIDVPFYDIFATKAACEDGSLGAICWPDANGDPGMPVMDSAYLCRNAKNFGTGGVYCELGEMVSCQSGTCHNGACTQVECQNGWTKCDGNKINTCTNYHYTYTSTCPSGTACSETTTHQATCKATQTCYDSDSTTFPTKNYYMKGTLTTTTGDFSARTDYCGSASQVMEYYCVDKTTYSNQLDAHNCGAGYTCVDGACYTKNTICESNDNCNTNYVCTDGTCELPFCLEGNTECLTGYFWGGWSVAKCAGGELVEQERCGLSENCADSQCIPGECKFDDDSCSADSECCSNDCGGGLLGLGKKCLPGTNTTPITYIATPVKLVDLAGMTPEDMAIHGCTVNADCTNNNCKTLTYLRDEGYLPETAIQQLWDDITPDNIFSWYVDSMKTMFAAPLAIKDLAANLQKFVTNLGREDPSSVGLCVEGGGDLCSTFSFLDQALPENLKSYSCTIGLFGAFMLLLVLLRTIGGG